MIVQQTPDPTLQLAQALLRQPSETPATRPAFAPLEIALTDAGFAVHLSEAQSAGGNTVTNLYARRGSGQPVFGFVGHLDVVPAGPAAAWQVSPFAGEVVQRGGSAWLVGRGAADMKGAIAAFVVAAKQFCAQTPLTGSIVLMITGDEEEGTPEGMRALRTWVQQHGRLPDAAIIGEAASEGFLGQGIRVGRRGSLNAWLEAQGTAGHVAYPARSHNAIHTLTQGMQALLKLDLGPGTEHFAPSHLQFTDMRGPPHPASNVVPASAAARFNVRFSTHFTGATLQQALQAQIEKVSPALRLQCALSGEPFFCSSPALMACVRDAVAEETGHDPDLNAGGGTSDGRFLAQDFPVVEFGLVADTIHQANECAAVSDLQMLTRTYRRVLQRYFVATPP